MRVDNLKILAVLLAVVALPVWAADDTAAGAAADSNSNSNAAADGGDTAGGAEAAAADGTGAAAGEMSQEAKDCAASGGAGAGCQGIDWQKLTGGAGGDGTPESQASGGVRAADDQPLTQDAQKRENMLQEARDYDAGYDAARKPQDFSQVEYNTNPSYKDGVDTAREEIAKPVGDNLMETPQQNASTQGGEQASQANMADKPVAEAPKPAAYTPDPNAASDFSGNSANNPLAGSELPNAGYTPPKAEVDNFDNQRELEAKNAGDEWQRSGNGSDVNSPLAGGAQDPRVASDADLTKRAQEAAATRASGDDFNANQNSFYNGLTPEQQGKYAEAYNAAAAANMADKSPENIEKMAKNAAQMDGPFTPEQNAYFNSLNGDQKKAYDNAYNKEAPNWESNGTTPAAADPNKPAQQPGAPAAKPGAAGNPAGAQQQPGGQGQQNGGQQQGKGQQAPQMPSMPGGGSGSGSGQQAATPQQQAAQTPCGNTGAYGAASYYPQQQYAYGYMPNTAYGTNGVTNPYANTMPCNPYLNQQNPQQLQQQQAGQWQNGYSAGMASCQTATGTATTQPLNPYLAQDPAYLDGYTAGQRACQSQQAMNTACTGGTSTSTCKRAAGYLDGNRTGTGGTCGIGQDPRYSNDNDYRAGYNDGVAACQRTGGGVPTVPSNTLVGIPSGSPVKDASDVRVRRECFASINSVARALNNFSADQLRLAFKTPEERSSEENTRYGYDATAEDKANRFKGGFDVGKRDALYGFGNDPASTEPFYSQGYKEGYACGKRFIDLDTN